MIIRILTAICAAALMAACTHKELDTLEPIANDVQVVFDWQKAPDHNAHSMSLYLYKDNSHVGYHTFRTHTGGAIQTGIGTFDGICINEDDIYSFIINDHEAFTSFKITTKDQESLATMGVATRGIPRSGDEPMRAAPARVWGTGLTEFTINNTEETQIVRMHPEELVCKYTVDIIDVQNMGNVEAKFDASISSMAEGVFPGMNAVAEKPVTYTFVLNANKANNRLSSTFYTFGIPPGEKIKHNLSLYFILKDGTGKIYNIDVTKQVNEAPNPKDVRILLQGLVLPDNADDIRDTNISISGWNTVNINISGFIPK